MGAQPKDFRYFLTYESNKREIVFSPQGWDTDTIVSYVRSDKYFGMIRSMSLPLQFVLDGADILRRAYYKDGIEAGVRIEVEQLNRATYAYETFFIGDIDFSQFKDLKDNVSVTLMEGGITRDVKAFEGVKYEYPLIGNDVVDMILPGVAFTETANFIFLPTPSGSRARFMPGMTLAGRPFQSEYVISQNTEYQVANDGSFADSGNWFLSATRNQSVEIKGTIKGGYFILFGSPGFTITIRDQTNSIIRTLYASSASGSGAYEKEFNETIDMVIGQKLFIYVRLNGGNAQDTISISESTAVSCSYNSVSDPSNCKGIKAIDLYKRIIRRISPGAQSGSYLLSNTWKNLIFTSGDGIRGIDGAKIKITFKQYFDTINSIDDAAFGLENSIALIENSNYFARPMEIMNMGDVKNCIIEPAEAYMFNSIKIGYNDRNTDETDGKREYNSGQEWALPIARVQKAKDWMSPARADQYGIEKIRVDYNVKKTEATKSSNDTPSDNDTFMIDCYQDGIIYRPILGASYQSVTGLANDEAGRIAYNLRITPKKNLLRHGAYLRSIMDRMDANYINFASAEKNAELKTVMNGIGVKENENILVNSLPDKYFIPVMATITGVLPRKASFLIDKMPFGFVSFKWKTATLSGYIVELSVDVARNADNEIKLLLTSQSNLLNTL